MKNPLRLPVLPPSDSPWITLAHAALSLATVLSLTLFLAQAVRLHARAARIGETLAGRPGVTSPALTVSTGATRATNSITPVRAPGRS